MMRKFYILLLVIPAAICMVSCGKDAAPGEAQVNLIVGKWTLGQEQYVQYIDAIERQNITMSASVNNIATVQFNKDGTFASASTYTSDPSANPGAGPTSGSATTHGTYSFGDNSFHMSAPYVTGLADGTAGSYGFAGNVAIPTYSAVSNSVVINELTANSLKLHIEVVYTLTVNNVTDTYKTIGDYSYSK